MLDYTKTLPKHAVKYVGENDLYLEIYEGEQQNLELKRPPILFLHGAFSGSWMWSKYLPHFLKEGWKCYAMNLRNHYKSRVLDFTKICFEDYLDDMKEIIALIGEPPILIGHSLGGILGQKLAEKVPLAGLVMLDSAICREVHSRYPYKVQNDPFTDIVTEAPIRDTINVDESLNDTDFQKKYLTMESSIVFHEISYANRENDGISVDNTYIKCPCFVACALNSDDDDIRGKTFAEYFHAEYAGFWNMSHTGVIIGQRYQEVVDRIMEWLKLQSF